MKTLFALLTLIPGLALAQAELPHGGFAQVTGMYATTGPLTLYVDPTGNDLGACNGTSAAACATLCGAWAHIPMLVGHAVHVTASAGNYAGCVFSPRIIAPGGFIDFAGSLMQWTPATGPASGTTTSAVTGADDPSNRGTLTFTGAGWTASDLRQRLLCFPNGSQQQCHQIDDNTTDTITISGKFTDCVLPGGGTCTTPTNTTMFQIMNPETVINSSVPWPATAVGTNTVTRVGLGFAGASEPGINGSYSVTGNTFIDGNVLIRDFRFALTSFGGSAVVRIAGAISPTFARCRWETDSAAIRLMSPGSSVALKHSAVQISGTSNAAIYADPGGQVLIDGTTLSGGRGIFWGFGPVVQAEIYRNTLRNCYECERPGNVQVFASEFNKIDTAANAAVRCGAGIADSCGGTMTFASELYTNCSNGITLGGRGMVYVDVTSANVQLSPASSITCTGYGILAGGSAQIQISPLTSPTGGGGADLAAQSASDSVTLSSSAVFHALLSKRICSFDACIFQ